VFSIGLKYITSFLIFLLEWPCGTIGGKEGEEELCVPFGNGGVNHPPLSYSISHKSVVVFYIAAVEGERRGRRKGKEKGFLVWVYCRCFGNSYLASRTKMETRRERGGRRREKNSSINQNGNSNCVPDIGHPIFRVLKLTLEKKGGRGRGEGGGEKKRRWTPQASFTSFNTSFQVKTGDHAVLFINGDATVDEKGGKSKEKKEERHICHIAFTSLELETWNTVS